MEKTKVKSKDVIIVVVAFLIMILVGYFVIYPSIGRLKQVNIELSNRKTELRDKEQKVKNLESLEEKIAENSESLNSMAYALPNEKDLPELLMQLEYIAADSKSSLTDFSTKTTARKTATRETKSESLTPEVKSETADTSLTTTYPKFVDFMKDLEKNRRVLSINSFDIVGEGVGSSNIVNIDLNFTYYYQE